MTEHKIYAGMTMEIAEEGADRVSKILAGISAGAHRAIGSALERSAAAGKTVAKRAVTQEYTISQSEFLRRTYTINTITRNTDGQIEVSFGYRGHVIPLAAFDTRIDRSGRISTRVKKSSNREILQNAFASHVGNHLGIFEREGADRLPVRELFGPSTVQMMTANEDVLDAIDEKMTSTYEKRIEHEITRLLNGWGR